MVEFIKSLGSGLLWSADEKTLVLLCLNDVRNIRAQPGEETICNVTCTDSPPAQLRIGQPASMQVSQGSTLVLQVCTASPPAAAAGQLREAGEVSLPLEHLTRRCGRSVYYTWFPLQQRLARAIEGNNGDSLEQFDRALRTLAREPRMPMVCLSMCPADSPEAIALAAGHQYDVGVTSAEKAARFPGLMASHTQHARLLQSLYRQSRAVTQGRSEMDQSLMSNASSYAQRGISGDTPLSEQTAGGMFDLPGPMQLGGRHGSGSDLGRRDFGSGVAYDIAGSDIARLKKEIESTTEEANSRINQASEAIRTLKDRVGTRQAEHERMRQETERFRQDADALELENNRLALQLERRRRVAPDAREQELERLRREADVLKEQKEALVAILEDLYGAVGKNNKEESAGAAIAAAGSAAPSSGYMQSGGAKEEGFKHMLPRPSELFASGVLEAG